MDHDLREALVASTRKVFKTLLLTDIDISAQCATAMAEAGADLTAEVDVWGDVEGSVTVGMDSTTARRISTLISGSQPVEVDARVLDVAGELASMITEGALGLLEGVNITASSPTIRLHAPDSREAHEGPAISWFRCVCECGEFVVESRLRGSGTRATIRKHAAPAHLTGSY